jgi:hypothetical protein
VNRNQGAGGLTDIGQNACITKTAASGDEGVGYQVATGVEIQKAAVVGGPNVGSNPKW